MAAHAGEHDDRLRADAEICRILCADAFQGPRWNQYSNELAKYGCAVLMAWLRSGVIVKVCRDKHRPIGPLPTTWSSDDQMEITLESVATALVTFRVSLDAGRWTPMKGATLRTYFAGGCALAVPNVLRSWQRQEERWTKGIMVERQYPLDDSIECTPLDVVDARAAFDALLEGNGQRNKAIFHLDFDGYSTSEIAEILNMTSGAVRAALNRGQRRFRQERGDDQ